MKTSMTNFDDKYEEVLDKITSGVYELAETFAEEQIHNFAKWLDQKCVVRGGLVAETLADEFIREQRS